MMYCKVSAKSVNTEIKAKPKFTTTKAKAPEVVEKTEKKPRGKTEKTDSTESTESTD